MKYAIALVLFLSMAAAHGQMNTLPAAPVDSINLRLEMASVEMRKAAWHRNTSIVVAVVGGIFTTVASDRSYKGYDQTGAVIIGATTAAGFGFFQWMGADHDRKASRRLAGK